MDSRPETGRRLVLAVVAATLALTVVVIVAFRAALGPERVPPELVRLALTVGLGAFLLRGAGWARWTAGVLCALGGLATYLAGLTVLASSLAGLLLLLLSLVHGASAIVLLFVPAVRAHFGAPRASAGLR